MQSQSRILAVFSVDCVENEDAEVCRTAFSLQVRSLRYFSSESSPAMMTSEVERFDLYA